MNIGELADKLADAWIAKNSGLINYFSKKLRKAINLYNQTAEFPASDYRIKVFSRELGIYCRIFQYAKKN